MVRPKKLKHIPIDDWHAMAEADQRQLCEEAGIQTDDEIRELSRTAPPRPVHTYTPQPSKITTGTATIASPAPAQVQAEAKPKLTDIRLWDEAVDGVSGERLRNCILFQLDVRKKDFWVRNMSIAHVRRHALALDEE